MDLNLHLELIKQRALINDEIIQIVLRVRQHLIEQWQVNVETKHVQMELIHLAMALGRIKRGYAAQPLHQEWLAEIKRAVSFSRVLQLHQAVLALIPFDIPDSEQTHLLANWYSLSLAQPWILKTENR